MGTGFEVGYHYGTVSWTSCYPWAIRVIVYHPFINEVWRVTEIHWWQAQHEVVVLVCYIYAVASWQRVGYDCLPAVGHMWLCDFSSIYIDSGYSYWSSEFYRSDAWWVELCVSEITDQEHAVRLLIVGWVHHCYFRESVASLKRCQSACRWIEVCDTMICADPGSSLGVYLYGAYMIVNQTVNWGHGFKDLIVVGIVYEKSVAGSDEDVSIMHFSECVARTFYVGCLVDYLERVRLDIITGKSAEQSYP